MNKNTKTVLITCGVIIICLLCAGAIALGVVFFASSGEDTTASVPPA
ncbi:MAG: hypothetical protein HOJ31_05730, partial [Anaerolineae bacterium]|nr:hypothetical protein [Anaerolineae bacterium]